MFASNKIIMKNKILLIFLFVSFYINAQIKGKITDTNKNPLSFVSVYLDNSVTGTTSNDNGNYILNLKKPGTYTIVFQFIGFTTLKKEVTITSFPYQLDVTLTEEKVQLNEIVISSKDNPADKIIRNVISNKEKNTNKLARYSAKFYSRGMYKVKNAPERFLGESTGDFGGGLDSTRSGIIYLSETFSEIKSQKKPKQFKEKIVASKVSGMDNGISFNRAEEANINFYENSIDFGNDLISPISNNAFSYYNYKLVGSFYTKNNNLINKIELIPKRKGDRVFNGFIYIVEDDWAVYGADVSVTGAQVKLPMVDVLKLKQNYNYSKKNNAWVLIGQTIDFKVNFLGFKFNGRFSSAYSDYNFTPNFTTKTFTNEVLSFAKNATKKDSVFWKKLRPVPLTKEETKDYKKKDSIKIVRKSKKYLDSLDAQSNKLGWLDPLKGYTYKNSFKKNSFSYKGPLLRTGFNTVQGVYTSAGFSYFNKKNEEGNWWNTGVAVNYGFSEKKLRPTFFFTKKWNNISKPRLTIKGGITTPQFNGREPIFKLNNTISSLFYRQNHLKIYEKTAINVRYSEEVKNGIYLSSSLEYAKRRPLFNTSKYSFKKEGNIGYTSNNPLKKTDFTNAAFKEHAIGTLSLGTTFVFGQKYLSYPDTKINIGNNKYPMVNFNYVKRFGAKNAELNSDVFIANIRQKIQTGNYGNLSYHLRAGAFLKKKNIAFMDYLQANGNQLLFPIDRELNSFNLLEYYKYYTNDKYGEIHLEHNFKGAVLSKIPLLNKLNFHLITSGKALFMADKKPYTEYAIGFGNIGFGKWRFLRAEFVTAQYGNIKENGFVFRASLF